MCVRTHYASLPDYKLVLNKKLIYTFALYFKI